MSICEQLVDTLAGVTPGGYQERGFSYSEPTAWAGMAMIAAGRQRAAHRAAFWHSRVQQSCGAVGVSSDQMQPRWPTALALLNWSRYREATGSKDFDRCIELAMKWTLDARGTSTPRKPEIGHDSRLVGWSWAENTHSWLEPTALFTRAGYELKMQDHPRFVESTLLLVDRLLPSGGCNYGNTFVLGQQLLPHVQPTGLVLWALAETGAEDTRIERSLDYLSNAIDEKTTTASLAFAVLALAAFDRVESRHEALMNRSAERLLEKPATAYPLAPLTLAMLQLQGDSTLASSKASHR